MRYGAVSVVSVPSSDYSLLFNLNKINDSCVSSTFFSIFFFPLPFSLRPHRPLFAIVLKTDQSLESYKKKKVNAQIEGKHKRMAERGIFIVVMDPDADRFAE